MLDLNLTTHQSLIQFIEMYSARLKSGELTSDEMRRLFTFYISERFVEEAKREPKEEEELLKYMSLGWYIYNTKNQ